MSETITKKDQANSVAQQPTIATAKKPAVQIKHCSRRGLIKRLALAAGDLLLVYGSFWLARALHNNSLQQMVETFDRPGHSQSLLVWLLAGLTCLPVFYLCGFYRQLWRFASIPQYMTLAVGTAIHTVLAALIVYHIDFTISLSAWIIYWMVIFFLTTGLRLGYRVIRNQILQEMFTTARINRKGNSNARAGTANPDCAKTHDPIRTLVIGAGYSGSRIIREMSERETGRQPVVLIDDDPDKHGLRIQGVPVVGGRDQIVEATAAYGVQEIIVAIPSASHQSMRELVEICNRTKCPLKILPLLADLIDGKVSIADIKEVEIEDLLGRQEITLDTAQISTVVRDAVVMITGGGGSIGSELCRQIARFAPRKLIIYDIYENNAYELQQELYTQYKGSLDLVVLIGSVRDKQRLDKVIGQYRPDIIFHAAAHKHVPLMEDSPGEAVKNNVFGTLNTAESAAQHGVKRFVLISTDKAVNPTNVMGATKRIAELIVQSLSHIYPQTRFAAVRFGNVLGSNGSVIPLFKQQIRQDRCVTVTHPEITRFFMTIPEAARLVIQAACLAQSGEIFVLDMGEPIRILDLAKDLIRLSGFEPETDVKIVFTGLRPGEKMHEELSLDCEQLDRTSHEKILVMKPVEDYSDIDDEIRRLKRTIRWTSSDFEALTDTLIAACSRKLVG
jgi:FlaA1/EpsC-like NDP-sugar epimerase